MPDSGRRHDARWPLICAIGARFINVEPLVLYARRTAMGSHRQVSSVPRIQFEGQRRGEPATVSRVQCYLCRWALAVVGVSLLLTACAGRPSSGRAFELEVFNGLSEGAPLDDGVAYFSFSIRPVVPGSTEIELISLDVTDTDGPVRVDAVLALPPDHEQRPFSADPAKIQSYIDALRADELTRIDGCGQPTCEVVFAVVATRTDSSESGVVNGFEVRYRTDGREYIERTNFAIGLCLPDESPCT